MFTKLEEHLEWVWRVWLLSFNEEDRNLFRELVQILKTAGAPIPRELANSKYTTGIPLGGGKKRKLKSR